MSSFLPFLGEGAKLSLFLSPAPELPFLRSSHSAYWKQGSAMNHSCVKPVERGTSKVKDLYFCLFVGCCLCLLKFTNSCSCFTLHLQMSSCHIWWPFSRNQTDVQILHCSWVSDENDKSYLKPAGVPTAKRKVMTGWKCFNSFMYSRSFTCTLDMSVFV